MAFFLSFLKTFLAFLTITWVRTLSSRFVTTIILHNLSKIQIRKSPQMKIWNHQAWLLLTLISIGTAYIIGLGDLVLRLL